MEEEVTFYNPKAKINLAGTLSIPEGKGKFPAVILISGSGPQNRDEELFNHQPFKVLADHLIRSNLAGHDSHGVGMLPIYLRMLQADLLKPNQDPELFKSEGSIMMFDGKRGYGQAVGKIAMENSMPTNGIIQKIDNSAPSDVSG